MHEGQSEFCICPTGADYVSKYSAQYYGMTLSGFAKVATELGIIGIVLWVGYLLTLIKNKGNSIVDSKYFILACSMIPLIFMHEAFSSNIFWGFLMILNVNFDEM